MIHRKAMLQEAFQSCGHVHAKTYCLEAKIGYWMWPLGKWQSCSSLVLLW